MDPLTQLGLLATIAATYSGFIAVFIVLARDGRFEFADAHFVQAMVLGTIGVIVMALTPPVLALMMPTERMWLSVTVLAIIGGVPSVVYQAVQQSRLSKTEEPRRSPWAGTFPAGRWASWRLRPSSRRFSWPTSGPGLYVAGVTLMLAVSIWCFIAVVFRRFF